MLPLTPFAPKITAVLFDLDGTLLDTAPDLSGTLNALLSAEHLQPLPLAEIRPSLSEGIAGLLKLGFNITDENSVFSSLRQRFLKHYSQHICDHTQLFPGIDKLIHYLQKNNLLWGIVTSKSTVLTTQLIKYFPLLEQAQCIIGGDTLAYSKPHPQPLLHACECLGCIPENCVYIGDSQRDIDAARSAGMRSLIALYGYIPSKKTAESWKANAIVHTPFDIIDWLRYINSVGVSSK
jgi:2-phosphoglycolate phosphatase